MPTEPSDTNAELSDTTPTHSNQDDAQYGSELDESTTDASFSQQEERSSRHGSGSEWSRSTSAGRSPSQSEDSGLDVIDGAFYGTNGIHNQPDGVSSFQEGQNHSSSSVYRKNVIVRGRKFPLEQFPEELLFQVISHLSASDLLNVKLVSHRFHDIVISPHAWINAFAKYFPGPDALSRTADTSNADAGPIELKSEKRAFTRLYPTTSWTREYLLRTKLLRCLARGKPAMPFAAPSPGKPNKGYATFTYSSRLILGVSHLHAKFGPVLDKRLPQFVHGFSKNGTVTSSDKRGKFDGWGLTTHQNFSNFSDLYPGVAHWGLETGEIIGVPNMMDLSSVNGAVYAEGIPGGSVYFLANGEKHGRHLVGFQGTATRTQGIPRIASDSTTVCSLWIAKTPALPRLSKGLIGILCGYSNGVVSAFSLGLFNDPHQQCERGELTARWVLCPGVPIVAIIADDHYSVERQDHDRVCAFAVNALGEVFSLNILPMRQQPFSSVAESEIEIARELQAWETGKSVNWHVVRASRRAERTSRSDFESFPPYYPSTVWGKEVGPTDAEIQKWLSKRPKDIQAECDGWIMQRQIQADFAGDDGKGGGESLVIFDCGEEEGQVSVARRYVHCASAQFEHPSDSAENTTCNDRQTLSSAQPQTRQSLFNSPSWSFNIRETLDSITSTRTSQEILTDRMPRFEWRCSRLSFGRYKHQRITATAIDTSAYAVTTCSEDVGLRQSKLTGFAAKATKSEGFIPLRVPGQRACFVAAGASGGKIFIWDIRAPPSGSVNVVNSIRTLRVIHTDSPEVTSLAMTALYLVHGGSEGLVQAWDPLASTLEPVRTISSRNTLNARRRAVIAAQQNPLVQVQVMVSNYAATAICLDPDPTVLRGIVAIGSHLRYWSFSSTAASEDVSMSQQRKINRAARGLSSRPGDTLASTRRVSLKDLVTEEVAERALDRADQRRAEKEHRRLAGRFGLDLLGHDASEEEVVAYAKLLSEEHNSKVMQSAWQLGKDATEAEIEAFKHQLNEDDLERWQFASWQERFHMPKSHSGTGTTARGTPTAVRTPPEAATEDADLEKAIRLSLGEPVIGSPSSYPAELSSYESRRVHLYARSADSLEEVMRMSVADSENTTTAVPTSSRSTDTTTSSFNHLQQASPGVFEDDDAINEAIRLSLIGDNASIDATANVVSFEAFSHSLPHSQWQQPGSQKPLMTTMNNEDDELAAAIRLSLQEQERSNGSWAPGSPDAAARLREDGDFPALGSPSSDSKGWAKAPSGATRGKGKGKEWRRPS